VLSIDQALGLLASRLAAIEEAEGRRIVVTSASRQDDHWIVHFNTEDFVESGNDLDGLLGNHPFIVRDDGTVG